LATTSPVSVPQTFSKPAQTPPLLVGSPPPVPLQTKGLLTASLYAGMRGREVIALQRFLQKNGWGIPDDGPVTGYFGKVTERAIINFQKASNLEPVGFVGPRTRALINSLLQK
jgi:N-acetylmuramoyl-L-alanine amidase